MMKNTGLMKVSHMIDQGRPIGRTTLRQLEESSVLMKKADIVGGLIGILIGLYAIWEGTKMPEDLVMKIGPSFFPNILATDS